MLNCTAIDFENANSHRNPGSFKGQDIEVMTEDDFLRCLDGGETPAVG